MASLLLLNVRSLFTETAQYAQTRAHSTHENVNTNSEEEQIWGGDVKLWFVVVGLNGSCQLGATQTTCGWFATEYSTEFFLC